MNPGGGKSRACLLTLSLFLTACAATGADPGDVGAKPPAPAPDAPGTETVDGPGTAPDPGDEVAYKVWSAEVFGSEGQYEKAATEYLAAAMASDDPEIAQRATEVAISAQAWQVAAMAVDRWVVLAPENLDARETATRTFLVGGDYVRAERELEELLRLRADQPWGGWDRVGSLLTAARDSDRTEAMVERLIDETGAQDNAYALYVRSRVTARGGGFEKALVLAEEAVAKAPKEAELHAWAGRLALSQRDEEAARRHYRAAWKLDPSDRDLALVYAELLRQTGDPDLAHEVLQALPDTPENRFTRIAFANESGNRELALDLYDGFDDMDAEDEQEKAFQAARSAEVLDLKEDAIDWYGQLDGSEHELVGVLRRAYLLAELGRLEEARRELRYARNGGNSTVQMETTLVEAQILVEADQPDAAFAVLEKGLEQFPDDSRLLYSRALIAVQLDRLDRAEADLRAVIAAEPGNAAALNALGYTLADRTDRLDEAERLVRRAWELNPEDPAIADSMGWVAFRLGRLDEAERYLRQALLRDRNAEIAAHLGEVLFVQGREAEAQQVWNEALRMDPDDPVLQDTLERYGAKP